VLAFLQAAAVALATAYLQLLGSVFSLAADQPGFPADGAALAAEAGTLAVVQLVSVVVLVAGGILALTRRSPLARWTLVAAFALQLALAAYWAVRLLTVLGAGVFPVLVLFLAAAPAVALGLAVGRPPGPGSTAAPPGGARRTGDPAGRRRVGRSGACPPPPPPSPPWTPRSPRSCAATPPGWSPPSSSSTTPVRCSWSPGWTTRPCTGR
jgi:hypothetical protein